MQLKKTKQVHNVTLEFPNGLTRTVKAKAVDRRTAEERALKFHPNAVGVKRDA